MSENKPLLGRGTILILALIAALGSLATQLLIPALPQMAHQLHSSAADTQLVISVYLIGLGAGQLLAGPLADRIGRKPVLLWGLALYSIASLGAALAPSLPILLAARLLQSLGGSSGVVTSRVLVGDLYPSQQAAAKQATLMSVTLISPAFAPVLGGLLSEAAGWRSLFYALAIAGIAGTMLASRHLPVTRAAVNAGSTIRYGKALAQLSQNPAFLRPAISIIGGSSALYMFLGTTPFLLAAEHGLRPREVGLCLMLVAGASIAGTFLVGPVERRGDAVLTGSLLNFTGAVLLTALALTGWQSLPGFLIPTTVLGLGAGMGGPAGISRVITAGKGMEGTAASLAGAAQMLISALAAALLGRFAPVGQAELGIALVMATGVGLLAAMRVGQISR